MASTKRQRELARQRAARQAAARATAQARRRRRNLVAIGAAAAVLIVAVSLFIGLKATGGSSTPAAAAPTPTPSGSAAPSGSTDPSATPTPAASTSPAPDTRPLACGLTTAPTLLAVQHHYTTAPPTEIAAGAKYDMTITTSCGPIKATLDAAKAPQTVNSFFFLARQRYFNGTECHRATTSAALTVLQCGDPTATGSGGPGYTFPDENLTGATYKRGTLAMANSGPNTNGSQFFLVDKDSQLGPQYTPFGTITAGLDVLDKIIANGAVDATGAKAEDGKPAQRVFLTGVTLAKLA